MCCLQLHRLHLLSLDLEVAAAVGETLWWKLWKRSHGFLGRKLKPHCSAASRMTFMIMTHFSHEHDENCLSKCMLWYVVQALSQAFSKFFFRMGPLHTLDILDSLDLWRMLMLVCVCLFPWRAQVKSSLVLNFFIQSSGLICRPSICGRFQRTLYLQQMGLSQDKDLQNQNHKAKAIRTLIVLCCFRKSLTQSGTSQSWRRQHFISPCALSCLKRVEDSFEYLSWLYYTLKIMLANPHTYPLRYGLRDLISNGRTEDPLVNVRVAWRQSACR